MKKRNPKTLSAFAALAIAAQLASGVAPRAANASVFSIAPVGANFPKPAVGKDKDDDELNHENPDGELVGADVIEKVDVDSENDGTLTEGAAADTDADSDGTTAVHPAAVIHETDRSIVAHAELDRPAQSPQTQLPKPADFSRLPAGIQDAHRFVDAVNARIESELKKHKEASDKLAASRDKVAKLDDRIRKLVVLLKAAPAGSSDNENEKSSILAGVAGLESNELYSLHASVTAQSVALTKDEAGLQWALLMANDKGANIAFSKSIDDKLKGASGGLEASVDTGKLDDLVSATNNLKTLLVGADACPKSQLDAAALTQEMNDAIASGTQAEGQVSSLEKMRMERKAKVAPALVKVLADALPACSALIGTAEKPGYLTAQLLNSVVNARQQLVYSSGNQEVRNLTDIRKVAGAITPSQTPRTPDSALGLSTQGSELLWRAMLDSEAYNGLCDLKDLKLIDLARLDEVLASPKFYVARLGNKLVAAAKMHIENMYYVSHNRADKLVQARAQAAAMETCQKGMESLSARMAAKFDVAGADVDALVTEVKGAGQDVGNARAGDAFRATGSADDQ